MSFGPITYDELRKLTQSLPVRRLVRHVFNSTNIIAPFDGLLIVRAIGGGGSGARGGYASGGSAATFASKTLRVKRGDVFVTTLGAGGSAALNNSTNGNTGGSTTITGPGLNLIAPGGPGGYQGSANVQPPHSANASGADYFHLGGRGGYTNQVYGSGGGGSTGLWGTGYTGGLCTRIQTYANTGYGGSGAGVGSPGLNDGGLGGGSGSSSNNYMGQSQTASPPYIDLSVSPLLLDVFGGGGRFKADATGYSRGYETPGGGGGGVGSSGNYYYLGNSSYYEILGPGPGGLCGGGGGGGRYTPNNTAFYESSGGAGGLGGGGGGGGASATPGKGGDGLAVFEFLETAA